MRKIFLVLASMAVASTAAVSLAGQSQAAPNQNPDIEAQRKLIREVADSLKKRDAGKPAVPKNWKASRTPWGDPDIAGVYTNSDENGIPFERPAEFEGHPVPEVLRSGHHGEIERWRRAQATERTRRRRPDLLDHQA